MIQLSSSGLSGTSVLGAVNAAGFSVSGHVAPGEIVSLYGIGLGPSSGAVAQFDAAGHVPTTLGGVQVMFDGVPAPLLYTGATQINALVPFGVGSQAQTSVQVISGSASSAPLQLAVVAADPSIVSIVSSVPPPVGTFFAAALNQDNSFNSTSNPAKAGSIVVFWVNGPGAFSPTLADGEMVAAPCPQAVQPVTVLFDGQPVTALYDGAAPTFVAGPIQVNAQLPQSIKAGNSHTLQLKAGDFLSGVVPIYVQP